MKIYVQCTLTVPVEVPDDPEYDSKFDIEENHCPGTGLVGQAIDKAMEEAKVQGVCWACNLHGSNKIIQP